MLKLYGKTFLKPFVGLLNSALCAVQPYRNGESKVCIVADKVVQEPNQLTVAGLGVRQRGRSLWLICAEGLFTCVGKS